MPSMRPRLFLLGVLAVGPGLPHYTHAASVETQVVTLTQTPCQFVESETRPADFQSSKLADCVAVNEATRGSREFRTLRLRPGRTVFRVTNRNVPYELGFWVRGAGVSRVTLPSVSGGGIATGGTGDYVIHLKPGRYLYSCPLNPTPDYVLIVE